jgi:hypothetical protein
MDPNSSDLQDYRDPRRPWIFGVAATALLLIASLVTNVTLLQRARDAEARAARAATPPPPPPTPVPPPCPECPVCADAGVDMALCPVCPEPTTRTAGAGQPPPPRIDHDAAAQGEQHIANAADAGERDPANLRAQRTMVDGVDRIVASRSPAAAERFLQRNLPSIASMDCAFRDPAMAEHVRMALPQLNQIARPQNRLTPEQVARYERDLRCPRE